MTIPALVQEWEAVASPLDKQSIRKSLAKELNNMLLNDFPALVQLLYRVDVVEINVKTVLQQNPGVDAGELLADLLLDRLEEKKKTREAFRKPPPESSEERW